MTLTWRSCSTKALEYHCMPTINSKVYTGLILGLSLAGHKPRISPDMHLIYVSKHFRFSNTAHHNSMGSSYEFLTRIFCMIPVCWKKICLEGDHGQDWQVNNMKWRKRSLQYPVRKIRTICHVWYLWKLARSCKQLRLLCLPDPLSFSGTALLNGFQSSWALKSTEQDNT